MKVRYGLLLAVMLAVIFAGAVFTDTASATEPSIHITNLPDHVNADSDHLTSDGCVDIELIPDPGYLFKGGTVVEYVLGSSDPVSVPLAYSQSTVTLSFTGITEDMDLNITDATVLEQFIVTIEIDPSAKCTTTYTDYAVLCGENREIDIHPPEDYEFNVGENLIYNLGSENDIPYEIKEGDENGFSLIVENVTEDITLRITSAPVTKTVFTVTVDPNGFNVHSEETSYKVYCGDTLEIAIVANDKYYFLKDTIFTFTQIEENDISYEVETDSQLFHLITKPIVGDTELTIESIVSLPVRYYATIGNNGYSSNYIQDISLSSFNPTRITKGSLYLTGDANGYLMMSAGVDVIIDDEPAVEHYDTRIFQYDGGYNSYFEISKNEVLVHVVNGVITQVIMAPGSSLVETENCNDPATVVSGTIINDTESDCVLTYDSTWIIDLPISAYKAYTFDLRTDAYTLHFMKDVPSTFNSTENMDGCYLFLCNSTDSEDTTITVSGFAAIFQNCTGFGLFNWNKLLGIGGSTSGPYTVVERNGMVKSVTLGPQGYIESDSKTYVNSDPDCDRTFTFDANGVVNGGFVIGIKDAADGITTYYSTIDAIVGDTSVLSFGDELAFAEEFNSSEGITLDSGLSVRSYGATNAVKVVDGDARFKIVDGKIVWIIVPENATLIDGSGMTVSVAKKGTADIEIKMDASGENISAVYLGGSSKLFTTLHDEGTITIDDVTVKNELGYDIEVMNTAGEEIIIKESSGNYVILEHNNTFTVCSADDAIDGAVSGDNIRIYGNASTSGDRNTVMTKAGFAHDDWDSLFRVLGAGVSVDGVPVTTTDPKYVHIENGELFVVKYYGYDANSITDLSRRWIWYESNLLCEYGAVNNTPFNSDSKSVYTEVPGEDRTVTYYDSWFTAKVWPYVEALETHTGTIAYNFSSTFSTPLLKKIMMYDAAYIDSHSFGCLPNLEYLYFDGPIIYAQSFYQCYALKEAVCPNVITINNSAFRECTSLKNVTCPKVEIIGDYAFSGCTALITIDGRSVSNSTVLSYIGMNAFYNCSSLERVVMPKATEVKAYAFYQCTSLAGTSLPSVTAIRSYAFYKCNNLTLMDLSAVRTIEKYAFYECRNLGNLYLPEAEIIGNSAFRGASNGNGLNRTFEAGIAARSIYIPKVTTIYGMAFAGCANLETVIAPSLISVYGYAFFGCSELKTFDAPYLISADGTDPYSGDKGYAFSFCTSLVSFNAPELTGLGQYFFYGCTNLVDVNIEDVATIGQHAFAGCSSIETLNLPSVSVIEPYAFNGSTMGTGTTMTVLGACTALRSVYMPNVNDVAHRAFAGCTGLESVVATNAGSIREYAFYKCTSLKSFDAPKLTVLDPYAFTFDEALTHLDIRSVVTVKDYAFYDCSSLEYVDLHSALTICRYAFYNCNELEVIDTHSVTEIKMYAFYDCLSLQHLDAPYLITIEDYAFRNDSALIDANIPCVKSIGSEAFRNCENLSSVNMPAVENLLNYCFSGTGLTSLSFGNDDAKYPVDSTIVIKVSAFENCSDLVTVVIGQSSNVTIDTGMNDKIFKDCSSLENVDIGKITRIGYRMFYNCINLVSCDVVWVENVERSSFESCSSLDTLTIGAVENNIGTTNSPGPVATHLKTLTVGNIGNCVNEYAFNSCDGLMTVELGNISTLGQYAFANCSDLTSFKCGMIHEVGSNAFYKCTNLEEIQIGGADIVNTYIFYECTALKYFNVESVPENEGVFDLTDFVINEDSRYCFYKCSSLKKVYLDDGTTCIPTGCFESCSGMEEMHGNNVIEICCYGISGTSSLTLIDLNRSTDEHVIISLFNNHSLWHSANEVHIGGFVVTSGDEIGKQKTLTLTNCTVNPYHPNGTISMAMTIGSGTSSNDVGYKYVVLNDGAEVRNYTFSGMQIINTLTINGDAIIGENAFRGCVNLESVTIIDCSPQFGKGAFEGCTSLISFTADDDSSPTFSAETFLGCSSLETFDVMNITVITDKMFSGCSSLVKINSGVNGYAVLNRVTSIGNAWFGENTITHLELDSIESVDATIFEGMSSVTYLSLNGAKNVADGSFEDLTGLRELHMDSLEKINKNKINNRNNNNSVLRIVSIRGATTVYADAFRGCSALTRVILCDDPTTDDVIGKISIYEDAFRGCTSLSTINLDWVYGVKESAFRDTGITTVNMPLAVEVRDYAFYNCPSLETVVIDGCAAYGDYCFSCDYDPVTNPEGKKSGLREISVGDGAIIIGEYIFSNCDSLEKVYDSGTCSDYTVDLPSVLIIGEGAFKGCIKLREVYLSDSLTTIEDYTFDGCERLEKVSVESGTEYSIGDYSFRNCSSLRNINLGDVVHLGDNTFEGCISITELTMPNIVTMGRDCFNGCTGLKTVTMDSLSNVKSGAFSGCISLTTVNMDAVKVIKDNAFSGCSSLKTFNGDIKVLNLPNVTSVEDNAFSGCSKFESIRFGVYLTSIGNNAFKDVLSGPSKPATQLIFPNSLTYIGEGAFSSTYGNGSYDVISIPSSVIAIGKDAFSARAHLTIYFNGNIDQDDPASTKMAYGAFYANGNINLYMWEEQTYLDLSDYISGKISVVKNGEHHACVHISSDEKGVCSYNEAVLLNNGYIILPYGETSTSELGKDPATLYFGMSTSTVSAPQLALLNVRGDHDSVAKSGDYFRPVISYTMSDDLHLYYSGSTLPSGAGGGIVIDADMDQGLDKPAGWVFDTKEYWYRDEIALPTFGGTTYVKDTVYGENAVTDLYGSHAEFYPSSVKMTLGYIETCFIVTVEPFPTPVHWVDAEGIRTTFVYFGETVDELPEAHDKAAYHFLWWSTVEGSYEEYDMVVPGLTIITEIETSFYAIYAPNTYYVKIYCSSPIDISGFVVDPNTGCEYFTMSGAFTFTIDGTTGQVHYRDQYHTSDTLMFDAAAWHEGYDFAYYVYKVSCVTDTVSEFYKPEYGDGTTFTIEMEMTERTYSVNLMFLDVDSGLPIDDQCVIIGDFVGQKHSYEVDTDDMAVTGILYSDLKNKVIIPKPLYDNTVNRYTYNNMAKNVTYGYTNIQKDDDQNLYINYESFRVTGGAKTDDITIAYYFDVGMYNIKYIYDDDAGTIYYNPVTVQEETKVSIANAEGKVKTGYIFDKWVVLTADGEETSIKFAAGEMMTINSHITVNGDSTNTIVLKGSWTPKTVTITFDLGAYPGTEPSITQKVSETFALPDGSGYDRTGYDLTGWYFVDGGSVYTTLTLTPAIYAAYVQEGEILPMYANWVIKTYSFEVKHYDPDDPTTIDCPTVDRYAATYSYQYLSCPVELWAADPKDISEQFRTLIGWMVTYTYEELGEEYTITVEIPIGSYQMGESTWQKLAEIAKRQGSDTFQCCQVWEEMTYLLYFDTNGGGALQYNTLGPLKINERFNVYSGDTLNKRGYTFSGWYCGTDVATVYTPSLDPEVEKYTLTTTMALMAVDDTITFTAIWTPLYHILYDANGGAGQVPTDPTTYIVGDNIVLASYETLKGTNGSKKIIGWNTDRNANDAVTVSTFSESLAQSADKDHNVRFYAVWIDVITYTVGIDLDGAAADHIPSGWIQQQDTNTYAKQIETGTPVKEMMNEWNGVKMTKEGYIFTSWGYTSSTVVSDMTIVCNFGKVENDKVAVDASDNTYVEFKQEFINELKKDAKDKDPSLAVALSEGTVVFDKGAISALSDSTVLSLNKVDKTAMSDADKKLVGDSPVFEIDFGNNRYFGDGNVTITLPYTLKSGENPDNIEIFHLKNGKVAEKMSCTYENGFVSFSTNHFSTYAIVNESYSESNGGGVNIGLIIGGIVGAIAVIMIAVYLIKFRKKGEGAEDQ